MPQDAAATIEETKQVKSRYFYHLDKKQWDEWESVFAPGAVLDVSGEYPDAQDPSQFVITGAKAIVAMVSQALNGIITVHHGHTPLIDLTGPDTAWVIWAMEDNLFYADGKRMTGYGHYVEDYARIDGRWCIARSRLERLHKLSL